MITALAGFRYGLEIVTVYSNLGEDALIHSIKQTKMKTIICNVKNVDLLLKNSKDLDCLESIIIIDEYKGKNEEKRLKLFNFEEVEKVGERTKPHDLTPPSKDDIAVIMYTSGSTGLPKGVMILHRNIASIVTSFEGLIGGLSDKDVYLGFLPLAHILELACELSFLIVGGRIGYGTPRTLTDEGAKPHGDLIAIKPTIFIGVPRIYDTIKKGALEKIGKSGFIKKLLFNVAFNAKKSALAAFRDTPFYNFLVFKNFKQNVGGNVRCMVSGGAPFSKENHEFMRICFSCPVIQGYGLTETCGGGTAQNLNHNDYQNAGAPILSTMIKLVDVKEMNYLTKDKKGEIYIKGGNVSVGYLGDEKKTKEEFDSDGWFHTGDVGTFLPNGTLQIIDRKKKFS